MTFCVSPRRMDVAVAFSWKGRTTEPERATTSHSTPPVRSGEVVLLFLKGSESLNGSQPLWPLSPSSSKREEYAERLERPIHRG